jgi:hypothetical protein
MYGLNAAATHWTNGWVGKNAALDFFMISISAVGVPVLVLAVACQWWFPRRDQSTRHVLLAAGFSFLVGLALNQLILLFVHRVRPYDSDVTNLLIDRSADFSFPSDHATATICNRNHIPAAWHAPSWAWLLGRRIADDRLARLRGNPLRERCSRRCRHRHRRSRGGALGLLGRHPSRSFPHRHIVGPDGGCSVADVDPGPDSGVWPLGSPHGGHAGKHGFPMPGETALVTAAVYAGTRVTGRERASGSSRNG